MRSDHETAVTILKSVLETYDWIDDLVEEVYQTRQIRMEQLEALFK